MIEEKVMKELRDCGTYKQKVTGTNLQHVFYVDSNKWIWLYLQNTINGKIVSPIDYQGELD